MSECGSDERITWAVHPAAHHPFLTAVAMVVMGFAGGVVYRITEASLYCAVVLGVFMVVLAPYFHRSEYVMDGGGISRRLAGIERRLDWSSVRYAEPVRRGIYLAASESGTVMRPRGMLVLVDPDRREEILDRIKRKMG